MPSDFELFVFMHFYTVVIPVMVFIVAVAVYFNLQARNAVRRNRANLERFKVGEMPRPDLRPAPVLRGFQCAAEFKRHPDFKVISTGYVKPE